MGSNPTLSANFFEVNLITKEIIRKYSNGFCDCLAFVLHKKTEKPISLLIGYQRVGHGFEPLFESYLAHAFIRWNIDQGLDIKGIRSVSDIKKEFRHKTDRIEYIEFASIDQLFEQTVGPRPVCYEEARPFADHLLLEISKNPV